MKLLYFFFLTFSILLVSACRPAAEPVSISDKPISRNTMPRTNLPMPPTKPVEELGWTILDSEKVEVIGDYNGKVLILDFWATYCPPCIEEIPHLKELQAQYGKDGLKVIGLHVGGKEDAPRVPAFVERLKIDYTLATPEDALIYTLLGDDNTIPQTLVFDRSGKLVTQLVGYDEVVKKKLDEAVAKYVSN
ncbi:MAG: TlpA family protein disulfide reductase [Pyrinomonadaceae bacterium]|nr:TlpA family protein disulfide reductase [Pyrinomonadaceae bacterium]